MHIQKTSIVIKSVPFLPTPFIWKPYSRAIFVRAASSSDPDPVAVPRRVAWGKGCMRCDVWHKKAESYHTAKDICYSLTHSPTSHPNTRIRGLTPSSTLRVRFDRSHSDAVYNVSPDFTSTVPDTNLCQAESGRGPRMARRSHAPIHATRNKPKNAKNCAISRVNQSQALTILAKSNASVWWHWPPSGKSPHWSMASLRASVAFVEFFALNGGWETSQSLPDIWVRVLV